MGRQLVAILFLAAIYITLYRGAVVAFVTLYLPSLLLLNATQKINLPGLPDMNATFGVIYGICGGLVLKGGEPFPFKWGWMDTLMSALAVSTVITGMVTEYVYTGVSIFGEQFLAYLAPYFLARVLFHSPEMRRRALWICVVCSFIIAFFTLIEIRLWPYFLSRCLKTFGLFTGSNGQVLYRFGFMRAQTTFDHPIDMGNSCLLMAAMIAVLAMTTSVGIKNLYVRLALAAALCCSFSSLSFTSWVGSFAAIGCFMTLWMLSFTRKIVILFVFGLFCGFAAMTYHLYNVDVDARRDQDEQEIGQTAQDSMFVRAMIIQNCWPFAQTTGLFGWGNTIRHSQLALESVDNSYMLFTMRRGFVFLSMFLMIPVIMALRAMRAFRRARFQAQWMPLAIGVSAVLGIMAAMYTVWFGFAYSVLWEMMVGMTMSMCDVLLIGPPAAAQRGAQPAMREPSYGRPLAMARGA
jgi:hypothetical protein